MQREVFELLQKHELLSRLAPYDPVLAGTVPIRIDVEGSDLDIICEVRDFGAFEELLVRSWGDYPGFRLSRKTVLGLPRLKANFICGSRPVEIFGQPLPVRQQNAYRHMVIEHRLLSLFGAEFREQVIRCKRQGLKTEPAFAALLGLDCKGNKSSRLDPYQALLELEERSDAELLQLTARF